MSDKEKCVLCNHQCCRWIGWTTSEMSGRSLEFYIARGCKVLRADYTNAVGTDKTSGSLYRVYVPNVCINLIEGEGCAIYERRPLICIEYEGSLDPLVQDVCKLKGG